MYVSLARANQLRLQLARSCRANPISTRAISRHIRDILFWLSVRNSEQAFRLQPAQHCRSNQISIKSGFQHIRDLFLKLPMSN